MKESTSLSPTTEETPSAAPDSPSIPPGKRARLVSETGSTGSDGQRRKRGRKTKAAMAEEVGSKRVKLTSMAASRGWGHVLTVGQGDTGQLGLGEDIMEKTYLEEVIHAKSKSRVFKVAWAGSYNTVALTQDV